MGCGLMPGDVWAHWIEAMVSVMSLGGCRAVACAWRRGWRKAAGLHRREGERCWGGDTCFRVGVSNCRCHAAQVSGTARFQHGELQVQRNPCSCPDDIVCLFPDLATHVTPLPPAMLSSACRFQYEQEVQQNPLDYDTWFDYIKLEESAGDVERTREVRCGVVEHREKGRKSTAWKVPPARLVLASCLAPQAAYRNVAADAQMGRR